MCSKQIFQLQTFMHAIYVITHIVMCINFVFCFAAKLTSVCTFKAMMKSVRRIDDEESLTYVTCTHVLYGNINFM